MQMLEERGELFSVREYLEEKPTVRANNFFSGTPFLAQH